ncbi:ProQ/FINO family protein [Paracidovorax citrulli]|uniref:ProQ/FINO family protein n=1 Tax=Paracidovorax citrulli TaxID=80869 RepID=UPI003FA68B5A
MNVVEGRDAPVLPSAPSPGNASADVFDYASVSKEMEDRWPHLFGPGVHLPLKVGITVDLYLEAHAAGSQLSKRKISRYLDAYCRHPTYLQAVAKGSARHDINGLAIDEGAKARHMRNASWRLKQLADRGTTNELA